MTVVVDASVALKWVLEENGTAEARKLLAEEVLAAPDSLFVECANVLRTNARHGRLAPELARQALATIEMISIRAIPARPHVSSALAIALELDCSGYDALYLAVAVAERATLVTSDAKLARAVKGRPIFENSLKLLGA